MAWPPPVLPINRTDATPQQTTHANDHNAISLAINDTVDRLYGRKLTGLELQSGVLLSGLVGMPALGTIDTVIVTLGAAPQNVRVHCHVDHYFGNGDGWINGQTDVIRFLDNAVAVAATPLQQAPASAWTVAVTDYSWGVAAGGNMGFKARYHCLQSAPGANTGWFDTRVSFDVVNL